MGGSATEIVPFHAYRTVQCLFSVSTLCLTAGDKEELLDLPTTTPQGSCATTPQMTRRQRLSDRIHELNRGLEEEREEGEFEDGEGEGGYYDQQNGDGSQVQRNHHYHKPNRIMFAHLAADRAMGFRIRPPPASVSSEEDDDEIEDDEDDFYFDENYEDCDVDESTTLRKPSTAGAVCSSSGQVKKIVNR